MRSVFGVCAGLGFGVLASMLFVTPLVSCSCPPGYAPKTIAAGIYQVASDEDAGGDVDHLLVVSADQKIVTETFSRNQIPYEIVYTVTGAR